MQCGNVVRRWFISAVLICLTPLVHARSPTETVTSYLNGYSNGVEAQALLDDYWQPTLVTYSVGRNPTPLTADQFAQILHDFRENVRSEGWLRTEILKTSECLLRDDLAMVSVQYARVYKAERSRDAVAYMLTGSEDWRIASVIPISVGVMLSCDSGP